MTLKEKVLSVLNPDLIGEVNCAFTETAESLQYVFRNTPSTGYLKLFISKADGDLDGLPNPGEEELITCASDDQIIEGYRTISVDQENEDLGVGGFGDDRNLVTGKKMIADNSFVEIKMQRADVQSKLKNSDWLSTLKN